jgi:predicted transcriptional regulator
MSTATDRQALLDVLRAEGRPMGLRELSERVGRRLFDVGTDAAALAKKGLVSVTSPGKGWCRSGPGSERVVTALDPASS